MTSDSLEPILRCSVEYARHMSALSLARQRQSEVGRQRVGRVQIQRPLATDKPAKPCVIRAGLPANVRQRFAARQNDAPQGLGY